MASSSRISLLLLLCIVFFTVSSSANASGLVNRICPQTFNPLFCFQVLGSDPRCARADILELGRISIGLATKSAGQNLALIQSLIKQGNMFMNRRYYVPCLRNYSNAIRALVYAGQSLNSGRQHDVYDHSVIALDTVEDCKDLFENPPPKPSPLPPRNTRYLDLASIVFEVATNLS